MNKKGFFFGLTFLMAFASNGQNFSYGWHDLQYGNPDYTASYASFNRIVDDTLYVLNEFYGDSVDADPTAAQEWIYDENTSVYSIIIFVSKYTLNGDYIASHKLVEDPNGIFSVSDFEVSGNGKIILAGTVYYSSPGIDFDPSLSTVGTYSLSGPGTFAGGVLFYETNGNYVGHIEYPFAGPWSVYTQGFYARGLAVDESDMLYVVGGFYGTNDFDFTGATDTKTSVGDMDIAITKIDLNSQSYVWTKALGSDDYDWGSWIEYQNGAVYIAGNFRGGSMDMDPGVGVSNETKPVNGYDYLFALKLDAAGNFLNSLAFGGTINDVTPYAFGVDEQGNIYITGEAEMNDVVDADPSASTEWIPTTNPYNNFILKYDAGFNLAWAQTFTSGNSLYLSSYAGLEVSESYLMLVLILDPGTVELVTSSSSETVLTSTNYESVLVGMNKNDGAVTDTIRYKTDTFYSYGEIRSIVADQNQNLYAVGKLEGFMDFNPFDGVTMNDTSYQTTAPSYDQNLFNLRLNWSGFAAAEEVEAGNQITVYPNPSSSRIFIQSKTSISQIRLFDVSGKEVYSLEGIGKTNPELDLSNLENGIYLIQLVDVNQETVTCKVIKR